MLWLPRKPHQRLILTVPPSATETRIEVEVARKTDVGVDAPRDVKVLKEEKERRAA